MALNKNIDTMLKLNAVDANYYWFGNAISSGTIRPTTSNYYSYVTWHVVFSLSFELEYKAFLPII